MPAKKKTTKKKTSKKIVKKTTRKTKPLVVSKKDVRLPQKIQVKKMTTSFINRKIDLVLSNLVFFLILFLGSVLLYSVAGPKLYQDLFFMFALVFGFVGLAFLIAYLVFFFIKRMNRV